MFGKNGLTNEGKCTGCGACCGSVLPLSKKEIKKIRSYVKKHGVVVTKVVDSMVCPFLDIEKRKDKCKIYSVRPAICREFKCNYSIDKMKKDNPIKRMGTDGIFDMNELFGGIK